MNLSSFSPACLPTQSNNMSGQLGHISGGCLININVFSFVTYRVGWGLVDEHKAVTLQETKVSLQLPNEMNFQRHYKGVWDKIFSRNLNSLALYWMDVQPLFNKSIVVPECNWLIKLIFSISIFYKFLPFFQLFKFFFFNFLNQMIINSYLVNIEYLCYIICITQTN